MSEPPNPPAGDGAGELPAQGRNAVSTPITASRRYPNAPLVGVGVAVVNERGEVLIVQRGRPPHAGQWGLPGGLIDLGERLIDAGQREVWEECGIEITMGDLLGVFEPIEHDTEGAVEYHYVVLDYWAYHRRGTPRAQDDAAAVAWAALDALDKFALRPETREIIHQAHAAWQQAGA